MPCFGYQPWPGLGHDKAEDIGDHNQDFQHTLVCKGDKGQNGNYEGCDFGGDNLEAFGIFGDILAVLWSFPSHKELKFDLIHNYKTLLWLRCRGNKVLYDILSCICDFCRLKFYCTVGRILRSFGHHNISYEKVWIYKKNSSTQIFTWNRFCLPITIVLATISDFLAFHITGIFLGTWYLFLFKSTSAYLDNHLKNSKI